MDGIWGLGSFRSQFVETLHLKTGASTIQLIVPSICVIIFYFIYLLWLYSTSAEGL